MSLQETNKVLVYVPRVTNRLKYIFDFMLSDILGLEYEFTINRQQFLDSGMPCFAYTNYPIGNELFIGSSPILFETNVEKRNHDHNGWKNVKGFFRVDVKSLFPFDPFGTAFYLLTRYDEHIIYNRDKHGRIRARETSPVRFKIAGKPVVDMYAYELKRLLAERFPQIKFRERKFSYTCTIDVDMAYSIKGKQWWRQLAASAKALFVTDLRQLRLRNNVLRGLEPDPYDTFGYITQMQQQFQFKLKYFWLLSDYSRFDKNIPHNHPEMAALVKRIAAEHESHLHVSYYAADNKQKLLTEMNRFETLTGNQCSGSRYHYLRFTLPGSYNRLIEAGIHDDYSMGYAGHYGFRAGTCTPFLFFDLHANKTTELRVHPFAFMDVTLRHYQKMKPTAAIEKICEMMDAVKSVDGEFTCIWHNNSLSEDNVWKGWRQVFEETSGYAAQLMSK